MLIWAQFPQKMNPFRQMSTSIHSKSSSKVHSFWNLSAFFFAFFNLTNIERWEQTRINRWIYQCTTEERRRQKQRLESSKGMFKLNSRGDGIKEKFPASTSWFRNQNRSVKSYVNKVIKSRASKLTWLYENFFLCRSLKLTDKIASFLQFQFVFSLSSNNFLIWLKPFPCNKIFNLYFLRFVWEILAAEKHLNHCH